MSQPDDDTMRDFSQQVDDDEMARNDDGKNTPFEPENPDSSTGHDGKAGN